MKENIQSLLTHWFVHMLIITAGPKLLAGFMLAPVNLICWTVRMELIDLCAPPKARACSLGSSTYGCEMSSCDGKSNGQWNWSFDVWATAIGNAMNDEDEDEGNESLDENTLAGRELWRNACDAQCADKVVWRRCLSREEVKRNSFCLLIRVMSRLLFSAHHLRRGSSDKSFAFDLRDDFPMPSTKSCISSRLIELIDSRRTRNSAEVDLR
jgi:hypothetical protein